LQASVHARDCINGFAAHAKKEIAHRTETDKLQHYENVYEIALGNAFHYEFSEGDLKRIQSLLNQIRELISTAEELEEDHRDRLLRRLDKLQSEFHKKVSDLDRCWGFLMDLGLAVGLMAKNAEPLVGLVKQVVDIVWPEQARAWGLPSNLPFRLPGQTEDDKPQDKDD